MRARLMSIGFALLGAAGACTTPYGSADSPPAAADASADASVDVFEPADAADTAGGLLANGDFEQTACMGWTGVGAFLGSTGNEPHTGRYACRVCADGSKPTAGITQTVNLRSTQSGTVSFTGWARSDTNGVTLSVAPGFAELDDKGNATSNAQGSTQVVSSLWSSFELDFSVSPGGTQLTTQVSFLVDAKQDCLVVDDAFLTAPQ